MKILIPAVVIMILVFGTSVQADSFDKICSKSFDSDSDGSGDHCCTEWRASFCSLEAMPGFTRPGFVAAARTAMGLTNCSKFANNVGGSMPITCYWQYRKWVVIMAGAFGIMAVLIPCLVLVARRRRRQATMMMF